MLWSIIVCSDIMCVCGKTKLRGILRVCTELFHWWWPPIEQEISKAKFVQLDYAGLWLTFYFWLWSCYMERGSAQKSLKIMSKPTVLELLCSKNSNTGLLPIFWGFFVHSLDLCMLLLSKKWNVGHVSKPVKKVFFGTGTPTTKRKHCA